MIATSSFVAPRGRHQEHVTLIGLVPFSDVLEAITLLASYTFIPMLFVISVALFITLIYDIVAESSTRIKRASSTLQEDTRRIPEEYNDLVTASVKQRRPASPNHGSCKSHSSVSKTKQRTSIKSNPSKIHTATCYEIDLQHGILSIYFEGLMEHPQCPPAGSNASLITGPLLAEDPQCRAALSSRATKTAMRIAVAEAKSRDMQAEARAKADRRTEENGDKAMRKQEEAAAERREHKAREEEAKQAKTEKQAAKQAKAATKKQQKVDEKAEDVRRKAERKVEKAQEKARKQFSGGTAWGYDPNAGFNRLPGRLPVAMASNTDCLSDLDNGSKTASSRSRRHTPQYYDRVTGKYHPKNELDSIWGIEIGGPTHTSKRGPDHDRFASAMAKVEKTSRMDGGGMRKGPESSPDIKGKAKVGSGQLK
jgi:hypothetical protein